MNKLGVVGYCPPPSFPGASAFLENFNLFRPAGEAVIYSDHAPYNFIPVLDPEKIEGKDKNPQWAVNNAIFAAGVCLAARTGLTHMIYIEADCRFGCKGWDSIIFDEYFRLPFPPIAAGSLVAHACVNGGRKFYDRFTDMIASNRHSKKAHPIPIYGVPVPDEKRSLFPDLSPSVIEPGSKNDAFKPAVYPNGALGVYDVAWLCEIFGIGPDGKFKEGRHMMEIVLSVAWDHVIGRRLYDRFGADVFDVVAHLNSCYSGYGNRLNTESERLQMLRDGKCVGVHQVKSDATV